MDSLANTKAFLRAIEDTARLNGGKLISRLWLKTGPGMCFNDDTWDYMEAILRGTAARDAKIFVSSGNTAARCCCCGLVYGSEKQVGCPACGGIAERISLSRSFIIDRVEIKI